MNKDDMTLGEKLRALRLSKKLTLSQLATALSISKPTISKYENGILHPRRDILIKISEFFGCSIDYLLGLSEDPSPNGKTYADIEDEVLSVDDTIEVNNLVQDFVDKFEINRNFTLDGENFTDEHKRFLMDSIRASLNYVKIMSKSTDNIHTKKN